MSKADHLEGKMLSAVIKCSILVSMIGVTVEALLIRLSSTRIDVAAQPTNVWTLSLSATSTLKPLARSSPLREAKSWRHSAEMGMRA